MGQLTLYFDYELGSLENLDKEPIKGLGRRYVWLANYLNLPQCANVYPHTTKLKRGLYLMPMMYADQEAEQTQVEVGRHHRVIFSAGSTHCVCYWIKKKC